MKRLLPTIVILFVFSSLFGGLLLSVQADKSLPASAFSTEVSATVGDFYLNLDGYIAPYASVVLTSDGVFLRSTVADQGGYFSISQVLIREGFSSFCLEAVDYKRLGYSKACFTVPPASSGITIEDIFLPPTIGLERTEIEAGGTAIAFGFSMPNAKVTLHLSDGRTFTTTADATGYYEIQIENVSAGTYELYADATYNGKQSLTPVNKLQLTALSLWEQFLKFISELWAKFVRFITATGMGPLWFAIPIIILIIILVILIWPEKFTYIYQSRMVRFLSHILGRDKKLHHWWFIGY